MTGTRPGIPGLRAKRALRALRPKSFGAEPAGERLERMRRSPQFSGGEFRNPEPVHRGPTGSRTAILRALLDRESRARRSPAGPIPLYPATSDDLARPPAGGLRLTWTGHASVLAEIDGHRVLFDPVWGERCSPFPFAGPKRLHPVPVPLAALGPVDVVVVSHDHYDHLDLPTIRRLAGTGTVFAVPLGVGAHLEHWGVPAGRLRELDWHETTKVGGLTLTATPAQHFCGRALGNAQHTLWASWTVAGAQHRIYHSGDTGYFSGFREIGAEHGPFDVTMVQVGAYDTDFWPDIHMTPEEGLRAHLDLQGGRPHGVLLPIHWGTFNLAMHPWAEPAEWMRDVAQEVGQRVAFPRPGQPFAVPGSFEGAIEKWGDIPAEPWWRGVAGDVPRRRRTAAGAGAEPSAAG